MVRQKVIRSVGITVTSITLLLVLALALFDLLLPRFVNLEALKTKIETSILESTGIRTRIKEIFIRPTLFHGVQVVFDNNVLFDPDDVRVAKAGQIVVNVRYLPLLSHQSSISNINFKNLEVYIGEKSFLFRIKRPDAPSKEVVVENAQVEFTDYHIIVDRYFDGENKYYLEGDYLALKNLKSSHPVELKGTGTGYFGRFEPNRRIGVFRLDANVEQDVVDKPQLDWKDVRKLRIEFKDLQLDTFAAISQSYNVPLKASGEVGVLAFDYQGLHKPRTLLVEGKTTTQTQVNFSKYDFHFDPGTMRFNTDLLNPDNQLATVILDNMDFRLRNRDFNASSQGQIVLKPRAIEQSRLNLQVATSMLPVSSLELLPPLSRRQERLLKSIKGDFASELNLKGPVMKPVVTGKVDLGKISIHYPGEKKPVARDVAGTLRIVKPGVYQVPRLSGIMADSPFSATGLLDMKKNRVDADVEAKKVDLKAFRELMLTFVPDSPLNQIQTSGQAMVDVQVKGRLTSPFLQGKAQVKNGALGSVVTKRTLISGINGDIHLKNQDVLFSPLKAKVGDAPVRVAGRLNTGTRKTNLRIQTGSMQMGHLVQTADMFGSAFGVPVDALRRIQARGQMAVNLLWQGTLQKPIFTGKASLSDVNLADAQSDIKLKGLNGVVAFTPQAIKTQRITASLNTIPFQISGGLEQGYETLALTFRSRKTDLAAVESLLASVDKSLADQVNLAGSTDVDVTVNGPVNSPLLSGTVQLNQARIDYLPRQLGLQQVTGLIRLRAEAIAFETVRGVVEGIPLVVGGTVAPDLKDYRVTVDSTKVPLRQLTPLVTKFAPGMKTQLDALGVQSGVADLNLVLSPQYPDLVGGTVSLKNVQVKPRQLGSPVDIQSLQYSLDTGRFDIPKGGIRIGDLAFSTSGYARPEGYEIRFLSQQIPMSVFRDQKTMLESLLPVTLPTLFHTEGAVQLAAVLTPASRKATIQFQNAGASMQELKYPIYGINGLINLNLDDTIRAYADNIEFRYGNSPVHASFDINSLKDIYFEATGTLAPLLVNDFLLSNEVKSMAYAAVPFDISLSGSLGELFGEGRGTNLNLFFNFNVASLLTKPGLEKPGAPGDESLKDATLSSVLNLVGNTLVVEQTRFRVSEESSVLMEGKIKNLFDPVDRELELSLVTEPVLDLKAFSHKVGQQITEGLSGLIEADLKLYANKTGQGMDGHLTFDHVHSPELDLEELNGKILFQGLKAMMDIQHFQIPGVDVGFTAQVPDVFQYPLPITDFNLTGEQFIVSLYSEWIAEVIVGKIREGIWEQFFPNTGRAGQMPFEILNGSIALKEGIVNNLIVNDFSSKIRLYPNSYFELPNAKAQSAGGTVQGDFAMNPRDNNYMSVHLEIDKMKANAVSRILLNVSNQVFGELSGIIDFTTEGKSPEDMLSNTNGFADLRIADGRLPSITRIENLLVAANTISGGLANLNLNSLFRIAAPFRTDYFAELTGTFKMVSGIIHTDDMKSDGDNLDLLIGGKIRMTDGFADLLIRGDMDREIGGVLGPLGDISIGRFLGILPPLRTLITHIPGIGFIPGFGGPRHKGVAFEVRLVGPILDPGAVQDFKWVQ